MEFPRHAASLRLIHNEHRDVYEPVEQWVVDWADHYTWVSEEQKAKALATDSVWTIQWYPDTPVGFYALAAADLDVLLAAANETK